jgi:hypothetical protein
LVAKEVFLSHLTIGPGIIDASADYFYIITNQAWYLLINSIFFLGYIKSSKQSMQLIGIVGTKLSISTPNLP